MSTELFFGLLLGLSLIVIAYGCAVFIKKYRESNESNESNESKSERVPLF